MQNQVRDVMICQLDGEFCSGFDWQSKVCRVAKEKKNTYPLHMKGLQGHVCGMFCQGAQRDL